MTNKALIEELRRHGDIQDLLSHSDLAATLYKAAEALQAQEWRTDMENAPIDDMHVRGLWVRNAFTETERFHSYIGFDRDGEFVDEDGSDFGWSDEDYTHWRPLPPAPEVE